MYEYAMSQLVPTLRRAGVRVVAGTESDLVLSLPDRRHREVELKQGQQWLSRSTTARRRPGDRPSLYVAHSATHAVVADALSGEFDLVSIDPLWVIVAGQAFLEPDRPHRNEGAHRNPGWGRQAVLRTLATADRPLRQAELAEMIGISQQAVSLALRRMGDHVARVGHGWIAREGALQAWLEDYHGPGGAITHWYGLDDPAGQARIALELLDELDLTAIVGGDLAADRYSPWQLPGSVRIYLPELVDFTPVGFSPAQPAEATMTALVPLDPTIAQVAIAQARPYSGRHLLTDPAIALWDLLNTSATPTAQEAAQHLNAAIVSGPLDA
ncbi:hypothetical protein IU438_13485 [Nocardia cyriacigeorgica]|uniref:MarR family transcriptional regulator n=1 Tax=Nocardia cyriacigeorgica TaxID=135487 RepID=UPI00189498B8|nr:MarR family transcriptional regulator [Nocardia cyriacigeorgica]MBF6086122.1 hypothetical protein [Nocardia cyriacigeorgica]MBF6092212.1 hypothetical protein [Nocardia cyriacigeorgica]MBF6396806.1 hypothetical protein [Nocardia cyriacigeorgica]MBF6403536.1 hypothetical protein [Nocardia cyriacigeorgica]